MRPREVYHIAIFADLAVIDDDTASRARHKKGFKTTAFEIALLPMRRNGSPGQEYRATREQPLKSEAILTMRPWRDCPRAATSRMRMTNR